MKLVEIHSPGTGAPAGEEFGARCEAGGGGWKKSRRHPCPGLELAGPWVMVRVGEGWGVGLAQGGEWAWEAVGTATE